MEFSLLIFQFINERCMIFCMIIIFKSDQNGNTYCMSPVCYDAEIFVSSPFLLNTNKLHFRMVTLIHGRALLCYNLGKFKHV